MRGKLLLREYEILNLLLGASDIVSGELSKVAWSEAKARGLKRYFTGKPCKHGNMSERLVSNRHCLCESCRMADGERARGRYREDASYRLRMTEHGVAWRAKNRARSNELSREGSRRGRARAPDRYRAYTRKWARSNPDKIRTIGARRRAAKLNATPPWFGEWDEFVLQEAAALACLREEETGVKWEVDHMVPLRAKTACGLHCAENIQVIPAALNAAKCNKMVMTEPLEWLGRVLA